MRLAALVTSKYSLTETIASRYPPLTIALQLAEGLKARGHEVTFFAPAGGDRSDFRVISGEFARPLTDQPDLINQDSHSNPDQLYMTSQFDLYLAQLLYQRVSLGEFDAVHIHAADGPQALIPFGSVPTVVTLHDVILPWRQQLYRYFDHPQRHLVAISQSQAASAPSIRFAQSILHGTSLERFSFAPNSSNSLLFVGRFTPEKGASEAVRAASQVDAVLTLVGKQYLQKHPGYWEREVEPYLTAQMSYLGERYATSVTTDPFPSLFGSARALINPIQWDEPFGLVMIESMACGTPVIAFGRGSVSEIVVDGETGYVVPPSEGVPGFARAIQRLNALSDTAYKAMRQACRTRVEKHFSSERMVNDYEKLFEKIVREQHAKLD